MLSNNTFKANLIEANTKTVLFHYLPCITVICDNKHQWRLHCRFYVPLLSNARDEFLKVHCHILNNASVQARGNTGENCERKRFHFSTLGCGA